MKSDFIGLIILSTQLFGISVTTNAATNITETSATLNGAVEVANYELSNFFHSFN